MLQHHGHLPEPVLIILAEHLRERAARPVPDSDRGVEHDPPAREPEPKIELVVLVADERLVIEPGELESLGPEGAVRDGVDLATSIDRTVSRPADATERAVHCAGNRALHPRLAHR